MTDVVFRRSAVSMAVLGILSAAPVSGQEDDGDAEQEPRKTVEEIVVTGSRIPRRDFGVCRTERKVSRLGDFDRAAIC